MKLWDLLHLAWSGLTSYRLRSVLTILTVSIGVTAMVSVLAIGRGTTRKALAEFREIGGDMAYIRPDPEGRIPVRLWPSDAETVRALVPGVAGAWPLLLVGGVQVRYGDQAIEQTVIGVPSTVGKVLWRRLQAGRFLVEVDDRSARRRAVLGSKLAENLMRGRSAPGQVLFLNDQPFEVTGVLARDSELVSTAFGLTNGDTLLVPLDTLRRMTAAYDDANLLMVQVDPSRDIVEVGQEVSTTLKRLHGGAPFRVDTLRDMLNSFTRISNLITSVMAVIAGVAMAAGGMGITNIMLASVTERTREIGIRRAVGASRRNIFWHFVLEATLLAGVGGLLGILFSWIPILVARQWIPVRLGVSWDVALVSLLLAMFLGLAFGTWPAVRAARMEPAEALRNEN